MTRKPSPSSLKQTSLKRNDATHDGKSLERSCLVCCIGARAVWHRLICNVISSWNVTHALKEIATRATREPLTSSNGRRVSAGRYEGVIVFTLLIRVAFNGPWSFAIVICPRPRFCIKPSPLTPSLFHPLIS